ncbi:hypothetical protein [Haladaptatus halobius]|nr:hypothetical protein [Haladaptatus halobius]
MPLIRRKATVVTAIPNPTREESSEPRSTPTLRAIRAGRLE